MFMTIGILASWEYIEQLVNLRLFSSLIEKMFEVSDENNCKLNNRSIYSLEANMPLVKHDETNQKFKILPFIIAVNFC